MTTTYAVTSGTLPAGLALNADGAITGTPTALGVYTFTVTATNGMRSATSSPTYTVIPQPPHGAYQSVTTTVGVPLALTPQNLGGSITTATVASGPLPSGMTLHADGTINGTPTAAGAYPFTVQLCNGTNCMTTVPAVITVNALAVTPLDVSPLVGSGTSGTPLSVFPTVNSGGPVIGSTLQSGSLPIGMTLNSDGSITGVPTVAGSFAALVTLTNASGGQATIVVTITVSATGASTLAANYPSSSGQTGTPLSVLPVVASGGPVTGATLTGGFLPPGLTLNTDGTITGVPTQTGSFTAQVQLCNATGGCTTQSVQIDVNPVVSPLTANYLSATGAISVPLTVTPVVTGGGPVTAATLLSGSLPPGLTLNANGTITGTPSQSGTYVMDLQLCNGVGACTVQPLTIFLNDAIPVVSALSITETVGAVTILTPTNTGGTIISATVTAGGPIATGLTLNANGTISQAGTTPIGVYGPYTVSYCSTGGCVSSTVTITVNAVAPAVSALSITETVGAVTTLTPTNSGGAITSATITAGSPIATGLTLNANGTISQAGTTPIGVYGPYTVSYCNTGGCVSSTVTITVNVAAPAVSAFSITETVGAVTTLISTNTGGAITSATITAGGPIATGLTLNANGTISQAGTTPIGVFGPYTLSYCNTGGCVSSTVTITVNPASNLTVGYTTPQTFTVGSAIAAQTPAVTNATPGVTTTFGVTSGTITAGLTLNADGTITGTPTTPGVTTFTVTATNSSRTAASTPTYTVTPAAALTVSFTTPQVFTAGSAIATQTPAVTNATPGVTTTFGVTSGTITVGLTLNADGTITGTPTTPGVTTFTVTATNGTRTATSTPTYTVTPAAALTVSYTTPRTFTVGTGIATQTPTVSNATPGVTTTFAITSGSLAGGLALNADGTITGTPNLAGIYVFTVMATNGTRTATSSPSYTVNGPPASLNYTTPVDVLPEN